MDDKELIKKIKNSFKAKKSRAEILQRFQERGYKLAYAEELIKKAKYPKQVIFTILITLLLSGMMFSVYTISTGNKKMQLSNPLSSFAVTEKLNTTQPTQSQTYNEIEITPEFISYLLNEIGAWQLHKNPLTLQKPIINFKIDDKVFYSEIDNDIKTFLGSNDAADLQFNTNKQDIINAIISDNSGEIFKKSIIEGRTGIELKANKIELGSKGYFKLYDSLK